MANIWEGEQSFKDELNAVDMRAKEDFAHIPNTVTHSQCGSTRKGNRIHVLINVKHLTVLDIQRYREDNPDLFTLESF